MQGKMEEKRKNEKGESVTRVAILLRSEMTESDWIPDDSGGLPDEGGPVLPETGAGSEARHLEIRMFGTLERRNGRVILSYEETELTGMAGATTTLSFREGNPALVTMLRYGAVSTALVFEEGVRHFCTYKTEPYPFEVCIHAHRVTNTLSEEGGALTLDYHVEIQGAKADHSVLTIAITPVPEEVRD